jgi:hypothetical protein
MKKPPKLDEKGVGAADEGPIRTSGITPAQQVKDQTDLGGGKD